MSDEYAIDGHKLHLHPERVAEWMAAGDDWEKLKKVYPLYVEISPVGQCNHRCTFCSVDYIGYKLRKLDCHNLGGVLLGMALNGVKSVMFAGEGEPLLHPDIGWLTSYANGNGLDVAFTTNATQLTPELSEQILPYTTWLKASVNAGDAKTYAEVHQTKESDFHRVMHNLASAVVFQEKTNGWCTLGAQIVLIRDNYKTVESLAKWCRDIGLEYLVIKPYSQNPNSPGTAAKGIDQFNWLTSEVWHEIEKARDLETPDFKVICRERTAANLSKDREYKTCHSTPNFWAYIMATGDVYGCSAHLLNDKFCFGNINEQSFSEIWEGEKRRQCVELMRDFDLSVCRKNCRMQHCNDYLWRLKHPQEHDAFV